MAQCAVQKQHTAASTAVQLYSPPRCSTWLHRTCMHTRPAAGYSTVHAVQTRRLSTVWYVKARTSTVQTVHSRDQQQAMQRPLYRTTMAASITLGARPRPGLEAAKRSAEIYRMVWDGAFLEESCRKILYTPTFFRALLEMIRKWPEQQSY